MVLVVYLIVNFLTDGDVQTLSVQTHSGNMTNQQPNNLPQRRHNNSTSFGQPLIQNPNQLNLTIAQKNGGTIVTTIMVENTIYGDVNISAVSV